MSFSERPSISNSRKIGCIAYGIGSALVILFCWGLAALGHNECSYEPNAPGCEWDETRRYLLFPGSLVLAAIGSWLVVRWAMKDDK